jgi:hypothetical protein
MRIISSRCIEQNDSLEEVMHEVYGSLSGELYIAHFKASCPISAMDIARSLPLTKWEKIK